MKSFVRSIWGTVLVCAVTVTPAMSYHTGPLPGFSGGPEEGGANCATCHSFEQGTGFVQVSGPPHRYVPGATYDLTIIIADAAQAGAGFEISAEADTGHQGEFVITDATRTQFAFGNTDYATQSPGGYDDSLVGWIENGGSVQYDLQWTAPILDEGPITFFVAGNAVNDAMGPGGDHVYTIQRQMPAAKPGDADGDDDADLRDFAILQYCFDQSDIESECRMLDLDVDGQVNENDSTVVISAITGPADASPLAYALANAFRGGRLYDNWWEQNGAPAPEGEHHLYPFNPFQSGSVTFRCNECHGWDYKGVTGEYAAGVHYTGINGVLDTQLSPQEIFDLLVADVATNPNGHDMLAYGLTESDVWDLVRFTLVLAEDLSAHVSEGSFVGNSGFGTFTFQDTCVQCHGAQGNEIPASDPVFLGKVADQDPWRFMHKVRFGHAGSSMPSGLLLRIDAGALADLGAYVETLPAE